jgi:ParB-like chromosome segregation protein Spo0J
MDTRSTDLAREMAGSERLRRRQFVALPLHGAGAVFTDVQGRGPGESMAPAALADLISSISEIGLLQPVLVEKVNEHHQLVAGERRLRAMRWGATSAPENPHFASLPAIVCPGPLTETERRRWQLVENLARERLQPGELAAALLFERCAMLADRLVEAGIEVPREVRALPDVVARFEALERLRGATAEAAAPWGDVLRRVGVQMSPRKARAVVSAFRRLPPELSADMDAHQIALTTRTTYLSLADDGQEQAAEIWEAVKRRGRVDLLSAAVQARLNSSAEDASEAMKAAEEAHEAANASRSSKLTSHPRPDGDRHEEQVDSALMQTVVASLRELAAQMRLGCKPAGYAGGSLRLLLAELGELLGSER